MEALRIDIGGRVLELVEPRVELESSGVAKGFYGILEDRILVKITIL